jgi:hypothetical protein
VEARVTRHTVEVFFHGRRVASHARSDVLFKHTTDRAHMPEGHRQHAECFTFVLAWAQTVGPCTVAMVERIVTSNAVQEQGWRSARGLQRVGEKYGPERTERACERALGFGARSYKPVERLLRLGREQGAVAQDDAIPKDSGIAHENVRGPGYFH